MGKPRPAQRPVTEPLEFGHFASAGPFGCTDSWGAGPFILWGGSEPFRFEDSDRFGPHLIKRNGDIRANPWPPKRSPFWRAHRIWKRQGRRIGEDGVTCIWTEPRPTLVRQINRRHQLIIEHGEEDGEIKVIA